MESPAHRLRFSALHWIAGFSCLVSLQCGDDVTNVSPHAVQQSIQGAIQKGPFLGGMQVTLQELRTDLVPAGTVWAVTTRNDRGEYALPTAVHSRFLEVIADGVYYDEVIRSVAQSPITLRTVADVSRDDVVNVNLLTTLETDRVKQLVRDQGRSFADAKRQAENEILQLFGFGMSLDVPFFDDLDVTGAAQGDALLLASTLILRGGGYGHDLPQLLSSMNRALLEGRAASDSAIAERLLTGASRLNLGQIRDALQQHYESSGVTVKLPAFEPYAKRLVPLRIHGRSPPDHATGVLFEQARIRVVFNQEMSAETLTPETFHLVGPSGPAAGGVEYDPRDWSATLVPDGALLPGTEYTATVTAEARSLSGRSLPAGDSWSFTTERFDLESDLLAYYPFDGDAYDASGLGHDAQALGTTPSADRHGGADGALHLSIAQYSNIRMPAVFPLNSQPWTYSIWFKLTTLPVYDRPTERFLLSSSQWRLYDDVQLFVDDLRSQITAYLHEGDRHLSTRVSVEAGEWYHVALIHADDRIRIFVNGGRELDVQNHFTTAFQDTSSFGIAQRFWNQANLRGYLDADVDETRLYRRALNELEIRALAEVGSVPRPGDEARPASSTPGPSRGRSPAAWRR